MMLKKIIIFLLVLTGLCWAPPALIDGDEMPFGGASLVNANRDYYFSGEKLRWMADSLGLNQHITGSYTETIAGAFADSGIYPYPSGYFYDPDTLEYQSRYARTTYYICHPEKATLNVRFRHTEGAVVDSYLVYTGSGNMLDSLYLWGFSKRDKYLNPYEDLKYYPSLKIMRGTVDTSIYNDAIACIFQIGAWPNVGDPFFKFTDTLKVRDLPQGTDVLLSLINDYDSSPFEGFNYFSLANSNTKMNFCLKTAGICSVYVDYFKFNCQFGQALIDDGNQFMIDGIKGSVGRSGYEGDILGWFLIDTIKPQNFRPYRFIDSLITVAMDSSAWNEALNNSKNTILTNSENKLY